MGAPSGTGSASGVLLPRPGKNAARGKRATQSSVSRWSQGDDAAGGVNGVVTGRYGFHTDYESGPWWQVDLGEVLPLDQVWVFNRLDVRSERAYGFRLLIGTDEASLRVVHDQRGVPFGGADGNPAKVSLDGEWARIVRVELPYEACLHLDEVEVYRVADAPQQRSRSARRDVAVGTVLLPFGDKFAGAVDMLQVDWFKALPTVRGISPLGLGPDQQRALTDLFNEARADFLVVDNTSAIAGLANLTSTAQWRPAYDAFIAACRESFDSDRIILVRTHASRLWLDDKLDPAPSDLTADQARALADLDDYFAQETSCRVSDVPLRHFPVSRSGFQFDDAMRSELERDLVRLCSRELDAVSAPPPSRPVITDYIVDHVSSGARVEAHELWSRLGAGTATWDDLIALHYLALAGEPELAHDAVRLATRQMQAPPVRETVERVHRAAAALRGNPGCAIDLPTRPDPDVAVFVTARGYVTFAAEGTITRTLTAGAEIDPRAVAEGSRRLSLQNLSLALESWPLYFERGRRGVRGALVVEVPSADELWTSCTWLDWEELLETENLDVVLAGSPAPGGDRQSKIDLSFVFDPRTRIVRVSGGMMDQVQTVAEFASACTAAGKNAYIHDLTYTYTRIHNGFVASHLAPWLNERRISRLISRRLLRAYLATIRRTDATDDAVRTALALISLGLHELVGFAQWGYPTGRRIVESQADFPVLMMKTAEMQRDLVGRDLPPVAMFIHPIMIAPFDVRGAKALRETCSFQHLPFEDMGEQNTRTAEFLKSSPAVALHVRRGDYIQGGFPDWHAGASQYKRGLEFVRDSVWKRGDKLNIAVFSDDPGFVADNAAEYGLDLADGDVIIVDWNTHFEAVWDAYLMSLCPVVVASVGRFAVTTALLADIPNTLVRTVDNRCWAVWGPEDRNL